MNTPEELKKIYDRRFSSTAEYRNRVWKILCSDMPILPRSQTRVSKMSLPSLIAYHPEPHLNTTFADEPDFLIKLYLNWKFIWKWKGKQFLVIAKKP